MNTIQLATAISMYQSHLSLPIISRELGVSVSTVYRYLQLHGGVLRTRTEAMRLAASQGRLGSGRRGKSFNLSEATKGAISRAARIRGELTAKGTRVTPSGYLEHTRGPHKGRRVHVVLVEQRLGRTLLPDEVVHHIDEDKQHNSLDNLALMTRAGHTRLHRLTQLRVLPCHEA